MPVTGERGRVEHNSTQRCRKAFRAPYGWILNEVADLSALTLTQSNSRTINDESGHEDLWHIYMQFVHISTIIRFDQTLPSCCFLLTVWRMKRTVPRSRVALLKRISRYLRKFRDCTGTSYCPLVWSTRWHTFMNFPITQYSLVKQVALAAKLSPSIFHFLTCHWFNCSFFLYLLTS